MITGELIQRRVDTFLGYGNLNSDTWFVGMEEGLQVFKNADGGISDSTKASLEKRFQNTVGNPTVDVYDDMRGVEDHEKWFHPDPPLQNTWGKLVIILLILKGENIRNLNTGDLKERRRRFQGQSLMKLNGDHCGLELMPLPATSIEDADWIYSKLGINLDYLTSRGKYLEVIKPKRVKLLKGFIDRCKPKRVIFYSKTYVEDWQQIIEARFVTIDDNLLFYKQKETSFFVVPQPSYLRSNKKWIEIGYKIKDRNLSR